MAIPSFTNLLICSAIVAFVCLLTKYTESSKLLHFYHSTFVSQLTTPNFEISCRKRERQVGCAIPTTVGLSQWRLGCRPTVDGHKGILVSKLLVRVDFLKIQLWGYMGIFVLMKTPHWMHPRKISSNSNNMLSFLYLCLKAPFPSDIPNGENLGELKYQNGK